MMPWSLNHRPLLFLLGLVMVLSVSSRPAQAQNQTFHVDGRVTSAGFSSLFQDSPVKVGDRITGTLVLNFDDTTFPNGILSSSYQAGTARFGGAYPFVNGRVPSNFQASSDLRNFGGSLPNGVGYFPDVVSRLDVVNGNGIVNFVGLVFADDPLPQNPPGNHVGGFLVQANISLTLVPEPISLVLLLPGLLPIGFVIRRSLGR